MPYRSEHAARVVDPDLFEGESFRRKQIAPGISIIIAQRKKPKKGKKKAGMEVQSYRFDAGKYTAERVRKWLKKYKVNATVEEALKKAIKAPPGAGWKRTGRGWSRGRGRTYEYVGDEKLSMQAKPKSAAKPEAKKKSILPEPPVTGDLLLQSLEPGTKEYNQVWAKWWDVQKESDRKAGKEQRWNFSKNVDYISDLHLQAEGGREVRNMLLRLGLTKEDAKATIAEILSDYDWMNGWMRSERSRSPTALKAKVLLECEKRLAQDAINDAVKLHDMKISIQVGRGGYWAANKPMMYKVQEEITKLKNRPDELREVYALTPEQAEEVLNGMNSRKPFQLNHRQISMVADLMHSFSAKNYEKIGENAWEKTRNDRVEIARRKAMLEANMQQRGNVKEVVTGPRHTYDDYKSFWSDTLAATKAFPDGLIDLSKKSDEEIAESFKSVAKTFEAEVDKAWRKYKYSDLSTPEERKNMAQEAIDYFDKIDEGKKMGNTAYVVEALKGSMSSNAFNYAITRAYFFEKTLQSFVKRNGGGAAGQSAFKAQMAPKKEAYTPQEGMRRVGWFDWNDNYRELVPLKDAQEVTDATAKRLGEVFSKQAMSVYEIDRAMAFKKPNIQVQKEVARDPNTGRQSRQRAYFNDALTKQAAYYNSKVSDEGDNVIVACAEKDTTEGVNTLMHELGHYFEYNARKFGNRSYTPGHDAEVKLLLTGQEDVAISDQMFQTLPLHAGQRAASTVLNQICTDFLRRRTKGERSQPLQELAHGGYGRTERALPDDFIDPYVGKDYTAAKDVSAGVNATEVFSMGLERFQDAHMATDFQRKDPEHFGMMLSILCGRVLP